MKVFKNILTGEHVIKANKTRAWSHFFYEARRKGENPPTMDDIMIIEMERKIIDLKTKRNENSI